MDSLILRLVSVQVLEKILRFERFLKTSLSLVQRSDREVIQTFATHVTQVKQNFYFFAKQLGPGDVALPVHTQKSILRSVASCFHAIDELHLHLSYVKGQWTCPETAVFVKALFEPLIGATKAVQD